jgi:hypothetical protein
MWAVELTTSRFEQIVQRTCKFDWLTRKYMGYYLTLLVLAGDISRLLELLASVVASRKRTSIMDWMLDSVLTAVVDTARDNCSHLSSEEDLLRQLQQLFRAYEQVRNKATMMQLLPLELFLCTLVATVVKIRGGEGEMTIAEVTVFCNRQWPPARRQPKQLSSVVPVEDGTAHLIPFDFDM